MRLHPIRSIGRPKAHCGLLLVTLLLTVFVGCQTLSGPDDTDRTDALSGVGTDARIVTLASDDAGPVLTVTNEFMDPIVSTTSNPPTEIMEVPPETPLVFCWRALPSGPAGGTPSAYRYGWDIQDLNDPEQWEIPFTPFGGEDTCGPTRDFQFGTHSFHVEVVDDLGTRSRVSIIINVVQGPPSFDIMPGTCKNPLSAHKNGVVHAAIPGTVGIDANAIDVSSVRILVGDVRIEPLWTGIRDIATPVINGEACDCPKGGADGIDDLVFRLSVSDITHAFGPLRKGETKTILVHGFMVDGPDFWLRDCMTIVGNPPPEEIPSLENRDDVLRTLEMAYNQKSLVKADAVFDDDLVFFFSEADIAEGYVPVEQWDRASELRATTSLFGSPAPAIAVANEVPFRGGSMAAVSEEVSWGRVKYLFFDDPLLQASAISLTMVYPPGENTWVAMPAPDPVRYPGETWYEKTVTYSLIVQAGEWTFMSFSIHTSFVVRSAEGQWRIVRWRDDIF